MNLFSLIVLLMASAVGAQAFFQIGEISVSTTATQAILQYASPVDQACSLKAADMNRHITVTGGNQSRGVATIATRSPHGLTVGAMVYLEGTGVAGWDGWQTLSAVADPTHFSFLSAVPGASTAGNVGISVDDLNPILFPGADQDSRPGNPNAGYHRVFVVGKRTAEVAADGNRYTRALQVDSRHHYTLTCGTQAYNQEFTTQNLPLGDTHNDGLPVDRGNPGQYAYPTVQWTNRAQSLIDPATGVRSVRATTPAGTASAVQPFQTAIDNSGAWKTPSGPLTTGGMATFTGPCAGGNCALFLRADNLSLPGGATYNTGYGAGSSLDWVTVTISNASISNRSCAGDNCKLAACLTVNGVTCTSAERDVSLTNTPASYTIGSASPIDLWQGSGSSGIATPDVSKATGTVNYASSTRQLTWAGGPKFSVKWTPGSRIVVAGSEYRIASIQSELSLTLTAPGPVGNLSNVAYSANNFGVLVRKKTPASDRVTIGYTTFRYGGSPTPSWAALSTQNCSLSAVTVGGADGYNCFIAQELYWISSDGADVRDLGEIGTTYWSGGPFNGNQACGQSGVSQQFDPLDGDTWYCSMTIYSGTRQVIVKVNYRGAHTAATPGVMLPDCNRNGGVQPCTAFTIMSLSQAYDMNVVGPAFNPDYAASRYVAAYFMWGGVSTDGDLEIYTRAPGQDSPGWYLMFTLGDRTPTGTGPNSFRPVAAASSYRHAPCSWCVLHSSEPPEDGWTWQVHNDFSYQGSGSVYVMTLTSPLLNITVDAAGGLNTCPTNPFGITGKNCTDITVSGEPARVSDSSYLQDAQVGDLIRIPVSSTYEYMRVLVKTDSQHLTVQRGYLAPSYPAASHSGTALTMYCGAMNSNGMRESAWDYRDDPYGANAAWSTILADPYTTGGHRGIGGGVYVNAALTWYRGDPSACPKGILSTYGTCEQVRRGTLASSFSAPTLGVADDPPFGGILGFGNPNYVDSHPGPCFSQWCLNARPMDGGSSDGAAAMLGSAASPWVNVSGQLWKHAGAANSLSPKTLTTMAYVGRSPLVDFSGPVSSIATDATGAYRYCIALKAGECRPDSITGDVYVNAPFVSTPYCYYPGVANQGDDTHSICIGPLGAYTGNLVQFGNTQQDSIGMMTRRLGPAFARWNQYGVYWNTSATTNGQLAFSQVRWLDGVRHEDILTVLPSFPSSDSVSRNTFVPISISVPPPNGGGGNGVPSPGGSGSNAVVEFGYGENGSAGSFFCTSRQEACVATSSTVNQASPFYYEQSETYSGVSCASGCTVVVPALSQRVLYYRWKRLGGFGVLGAFSDTRAIVTP